MTDKDIDYEKKLNFDYKDEDTITSANLEAQFTHRYIKIHGEQVCNKNEAFSSITDINNTQLAVVTSEGSICVTNKDKFTLICSYKPHDQLVTDVRFSPENDKLLYSCSIDGSIKMYDFRSNKIEKNITFEDDKKPLTTLDVNPTDRLLATGSELMGEDAYIIFWDLCSEKLLGGYWNSHSDDICYVRFNPDKPNTLASSAMDGLINIFDITKTDESDALTYTLNANDTVNSFCWRNQNKKVDLLAYTDVYSIQLWDIEGSVPAHCLDREKISKALCRKVPGEVYPVSLNYPFDKNPLILAGSGLENVNKQSCLRTLRINEKSGVLEPHGLLVDSDNGVQSITKAAHFDTSSNNIITVEENGVISSWHLKDSMKHDEFKHKNSKFKHKKNPY